jgi:SNF2 family DNA or RNA helicase
MATVTLTIVNHTPVFVVPGDGAAHARVYGGVRDKAKGRWLYPAYPPFGKRVLQDIATAFPGAVLDALAQQQAGELDQIDRRVADQVLPAIPLPIKPFDHQMQGLATLYHNPRWGLLWDPGVGKTKVICDLKLMLPGQKMLVLAPRVVVSTWLRELNFHSAGQIKAAAITGTRENKIEVINSAQNYDVLVTTYGTARTMGFPALGNKAKAILTAAKKPGVQAVAKLLAQLPSTIDQADWAKKWTAGATDAEIAAVVAAAPRNWIGEIDYRIIVADESHNMKQVNSKQTQAALALSAKAGRRYILSGTPALGDPRHLYGQLKFLASSLMPENWFEFGNKFLVKSPYNEHIVTGFKNLHIINGRVDSVALRRTKEECLDLPGRQTIDVQIEPSKQQIKWYNDALDSVADLLNEQLKLGPEDSFVDDVNAAVRLNKLAQILSGFMYVQKPGGEREVLRTKENPRIDALKELLEIVLASDTNKALVWCVFKVEMEDICGLLEREGIGYVRLDGKTSGDSGALLAQFESDPRCRVLVGQISTGIGFTANAAAYTIYYSLDWSLEKYLQSNDRNYRAGQTKKVTVYRLGVKNSVDSYKVKALDLKQDISKILTSKIACVTCHKQDSCLEAGITAFQEGCIYKKSVDKKTVKPKYLEVNDGEESDDEDNA